MALNFTADEVFEMAEHLEVHGAEFYNAAAESVDDKKLKDLFYALAEWEIKHKELFASLRENLSAHEQTQITFDPNKETTRYLKSLVDGMVSFEHTLKADSPKEILKAAIESEKDSVTFYSAMRDAVPEAFGRSKINDIIDEEAAHVRILGNQLGKLLGRAKSVDIDTKTQRKQDKKELKKVKKAAAKRKIECVGEANEEYYHEHSKFKQSVEHETVEAWGEDGVNYQSIIIEEEDI